MGIINYIKKAITGETKPAFEMPASEIAKFIYRVHALTPEDRRSEMAKLYLELRHLPEAERNKELLDAYHMTLRQNPDTESAKSYFRLARRNQWINPSVQNIEMMGEALLRYDQARGIKPDFKRYKFNTCSEPLTFMKRKGISLLEEALRMTRVREDRHREESILGKLSCTQEPYGTKYRAQLKQLPKGDEITEILRRRRDERRKDYGF